MVNGQFATPQRVYGGWAAGARVTAAAAGDGVTAVIVGVFLMAGSLLFLKVTPVGGAEAQILPQFAEMPNLCGAWVLDIAIPAFFL